MQYKLIITKAILFIMVFASCEKINYYADKDYKEVKTLVLAHKGGGDSPFQENSLEASEYGFASLDGIEVDIQISKDRTIWLSHGADLSDCGGVLYDCFPEAFDHEIVSLDSCNGNVLNFSRLEEIFEFMSSTYPDKYISLDVKAWSPCRVTSLSVTGVMNVIADEIIRLTKKYNLQNHVMVESETASFLNYLQKHSHGVERYLTTLGDFERGMLLALEAGYTGLSFKYKFDEEISVEHVQLIRRKGLKIQLWTIDSEEDMKEALSLNPDFIQSDNINYFVNISNK
jgi:glycerophosphoryl diester phosphodiesterase